jgi:hypothetical protein
MENTQDQAGFLSALSSLLRPVPILLTNLHNSAEPKVQNCAIWELSILSRNLHHADEKLTTRLVLGDERERSQLQ